MGTDMKLKKHKNVNIAILMECIIGLAFVLLFIISLLFGKHIELSSGHGVLIARNLRLAGIAGIIITASGIAVTAMRAYKKRTGEAAQAEAKDTLRMSEDENYNSKFSWKNEEEILKALDSYGDYDTTLNDHIEKLKTYVRDVTAFKTQLNKLKHMAYSDNIKTHVDFITEELEDVENDVYKMIEKVEPALEYYIQFTNSGGKDFEQYRKTALQSVNKCIGNAGELLGHYKNIIKILDKAVGDEEISDGYAIVEAEATLEVLKAFIKKEER
jgi:hypothetical protein